MKANSDKCNFLLSRDVNTKIPVSSFNIKNIHSQQILGVTIDCKLHFHDHISNLCKRASTNVRKSKEIIMKAILLS